MHGGHLTCRCVLFALRMNATAQMSLCLLLSHAQIDECTFVILDHYQALFSGMTTDDAFVIAGGLKHTLLRPGSVFFILCGGESFCFNTTVGLSSHFNRSLYEYGFVLSTTLTEQETESEWQVYKEKLATANLITRPPLCTEQHDLESLREKITLARGFFCPANVEEIVSSTGWGDVFLGLVIGIVKSYCRDLRGLPNTTVIGVSSHRRLLALAEGVDSPDIEEKHILVPQTVRDGCKYVCQDVLFHLCLANLLVEVDGQLLWRLQGE